MGNQCVPLQSRKRQRTQCPEQLEFEDKQNFRTVSIKISTYFTHQSLEYYTDLINQIVSQNICLHLKIKISSYLEDELSYNNVSTILQEGHHATMLSLNFSNSLLRKRMIFKIIKLRLSEYYQLQFLHLDIGFTYIPNATIKILLEGVSRCKSIRRVKFDFQLDIFIKKHNEKKEDKKALPNDKITSLVAQTLSNCKHIQYASLNFSQIQQRDQDYKLFFSELKHCHHLRSLELILHNCQLDDNSLEQIGSVLFENSNLVSLILHISNNSFKQISSIFNTYQRVYSKSKEDINYSSLYKNQSQLKEFGLMVNGFKCSDEDLNQFILNFKYFPQMTSFQLQISSNNHQLSLFTSVIYHFMENINSIAINFNMFGDDDFQHTQRNKFLRYWRKKKRMVSIRNISSVQ